ncbi:MAG: PD-(D/E)XK nuclease family protein [Parcubacteria group bacterium]
MTKYYRAKKSRGLYDPQSAQPHKLSRSKIDLFIECPRCFYLDVRLGTARPPGFPFNLNSAVDALLKKEFDIHRAKQTKHPLMTTYKIDALPFYHAKLNEWRENFIGVRALHKPTNFLIFGAVDDIWQNPKGELIVVDYKSTSKTPPITLDAPWQDSYKRQMEIYQWLLRQNGFAVSKTGYFVYCNGRRDRQAFDKKLEFDVELIPYTGDDGWIESVLTEIKHTLETKSIPKAGPNCDYCSYAQTRQDLERANTQSAHSLDTGLPLV